MFKATDIVYISGPMSRKTHWNFPKFFGVEASLRNSYGCKVLNPSKHEPGLTWHQYMIMDKAMVEVCTHILMLDGWEHSTGARVEKEWAEEWGKAVVYESELMQKQLTEAVME